MRGRQIPLAEKTKTIESDSAKQEDQRGQGFPQILHDRARGAAEELHRLLISLSTAGVGVFFVSLTGKTEPQLTLVQRVSVLVALLTMAGAALSGIVSWYSDCRRNYFWASALMAKERAERSKLYRQREHWLKLAHGAARCLLALFVVGILASMVYMVCRILGV
jgi:hypothetical protein